MKPPLIAGAMRPELQDWLRRHAEHLIAGAILIGGVWLAVRGGWFFGVIGALAVLVGAALLIGALRRGAFSRPVASPGMVEIDEGAIRFYGARTLGGEIGRSDLVEIRLITVASRAHWRLRSAEGEALLIPVDATGADRLADAFAALPGLDMRTVVEGLEQVSSGALAARVVWLRPR